MLIKQAKEKIETFKVVGDFDFKTVTIMYRNKSKLERLMRIHFQRMGIDAIIRLEDNVFYVNKGGA